MTIKSITQSEFEKERKIRSVKYGEYIRQRDQKRLARITKKIEKVKSILELANQGKTNKDISNILGISLPSLLQLKRYGRDNGFIFEKVQIGRPRKHFDICSLCGQKIKK